jgi:hypothetical protein
MQIDFHHAVTYITARLAGFPHPDSCIIAYAAQYVDNATNKGTIRFTDGSTYTRIASAYDVFDVDHNCKNIEDFQVWVPFHFLPGNDGTVASQSSADSETQRLICIPDSPLANDMWAACRATKGARNALHRLGITAHVYMDTFAHRLFAGIRHDVNLVFDLRHIDPQCNELLERLKETAADTLRLGHGGALTDPDLPFLRWSYKNSYKQEQVRDNPAIFCLAVTRLFAQFRYYLGGAESDTILAKDLSVVSENIPKIVSTDAGARHEQWIALAKAGSFSFGALSDAELVEVGYTADGPGSWKSAALGVNGEPTGPIVRSASFDTSNWKLFHDALKEHQSEILSMILPRYGLPRSYTLASV